MFRLTFYFHTQLSFCFACLTPCLRKQGHSRSFLRLHLLGRQLAKPLSIRRNALQYIRHDWRSGFSGKQLCVACGFQRCDPGVGSIHQPEFANDGFYGNGASWIGNSSSSWIYLWIAVLSVLLVQSIVLFPSLRFLDKLSGWDLVAVIRIAASTFLSILTLVRIFCEQITRKHWGYLPLSAFVLAPFTAVVSRTLSRASRSSSTKRIYCSRSGRSSSQL